MAGRSSRTSCSCRQNYENEPFKAPLHTFVANPGDEPAAGSVTRVLASDLDTLSTFLAKNFNYKTGAYENLPRKRPASGSWLRTDYNLNNSNKISFRYSQLDSSSDENLSSSTSAGLGRSTFSTAS